MEIKTAVEKAEAGGWKPPQVIPGLTFAQSAFVEDNGLKARMCLDPAFWQALGKVEGWKEWYYGWFVNKPHGGEWKWVEHKDGTVHWGGLPNEAPNITTFRDGWVHHMHRMIDALAEGKTVEQFLETL